MLNAFIVCIIAKMLVLCIVIHGCSWRLSKGRSRPYDYVTIQCIYGLLFFFFFTSLFRSAKSLLSTCETESRTVHSPCQVVDLSYRASLLKRQLHPRHSVSSSKYASFCVHFYSASILTTYIVLQSIECRLLVNISLST